MRCRVRSLLILAVTGTPLALAGCSADDAPLDALAASRSDREAARGVTSPGFYWLAPLGRTRQTSGAFAASATPTVVIDDVTARTRVATFTRSAGTGGEVIRVSASARAFEVAWRTRGLAASASHDYQIRVFVPDSAACTPEARRIAGLGCELGSIDVRGRRSHDERGDERGDDDDDDDAPCADGRTIPVRFRIDLAAVDRDADGRLDWLDNCPTTSNASQLDSLGNGVGDACRCAGVVCAASDACHVAGACVPATGACTNPAAPDGVSCSLPGATGACAAGACAVAACDAGRADCNGAAADGCEADLTNAASCGACGNVCAAGSVCTAGACVVPCAAGTTACGSACVSLAVDRANCGACGSACGAGQVCVEGACASAWARTLGWAGGAASVTRDPRTGVIYVATNFTAGADLGGVTPTPSGSSDIALVAYSAAGTLLWHRQVRTEAGDAGAEMALDTAGNVYLAGASASGGTFDGGPTFAALVGTSTAWLVSYTAGGAYRWHRTLPASLPASFGRRPARLAASRDHVVLLASLNAGTHDLGGGPLAGNESALVRYATADGAFVSAVSEANWFPGTVALDATGRAYIAGAVPGPTQQVPRLRVRDAAGAEVWTRSEPAPANAYLGVAVAPNGDSYAAGISSGSPLSALIHVRDASGATRWTRSGLSGVYPGDIALDGAGGLYLAGQASLSASAGGPTTTGGNEGIVVGYAAADGAFRFQRRNNASSTRAIGVVPLAGSLLIVTDNPGNVGTVIGYGYASSTIASTGQQHALHLQPAD